MLLGRRPPRRGARLAALALARRLDGRVVVLVVRAGLFGGGAGAAPLGWSRGGGRVGLGARLAAGGGLALGRGGVEALVLLGGGDLLPVFVDNVEGGAVVVKAR